MVKWNVSGKPDSTVIGLAFSIKIKHEWRAQIRGHKTGV
jgi:hypothetical protein